MLVARHHNLHEIHLLNNRLQLCRTDVNTGIPTLALMSARAADIAPSPIIRRSECAFSALEQQVRPFFERFPAFEVVE